MKKPIIIFIILLLILSVLATRSYRQISSNIKYIISRKTIADVQTSIKDTVKPKIDGYLKKAGIIKYPEKLTFIALKDKKVLELWFEDKGKKYYIRDYKILAASGKKGPKLRKGDNQVPEGIYKITFLNPNSRYHLSMKIDYPNNYDKKIAMIERRTDLGGDIFIHGSAASIGCIAVGDAAIEELFYLVSKVGMKNVKVIIAPYDFRIKPIEKVHKHKWINELYENISSEINSYTK